MSAYRIFINNIRVSTAVALENGSYLQVYPSKVLCEDKMSWLYRHVMVREEVTIVDPEGVSTVFTPELYTLLYDGHFAASAGVRIMKEWYLQWYPETASFKSRDQLIGEHIVDGTMGAELCIHRVYGVKTIHPPIYYPEEPSVKVSAWAKMSQEQRKHRLQRMYDARMYNKAQRERRALGGVHVVLEEDNDLSQYVMPNPLAREDYWTEHTPGLSAGMRAILSILGPVRNSGEGCDCGEC